MVATVGTAVGKLKGAGAVRIEGGTIRAVEGADRSRWEALAGAIESLRSGDEKPLDDFDDARRQAVERAKNLGIL